MAKPASVFVCTDCGGESLRWAGQCPHCQAWNTLQEFKIAAPVKNRTAAARGNAAPARALPLTEIDLDAEPRLVLPWNELNRVLGGGVVAGSLVLVGGEPGVGKSTLLMHLAAQVADRGPVLYASGEESALQVRMRAGRLGAVHPGVLLLAENDLDIVIRAIGECSPRAAIVDSIQTVYDGGVQATAGSVSQIRECAGRLMRLAKESGVPIFLVGHVTKEGALAGPRVLEHMVDTVLYLEGDRHQEFRILRATKNRFGSTDEIGIFTMGGAGLEEVADPSAALLEGSSLTAGGTVVLATVEGTRPLLVELQGLVSRNSNPNIPPRRSANGIDANRLHMIVAVIEKRMEIPLGGADIFVNVAGGFHVSEPAADLGLALSIISSERNRPLPGGTVVIGELGLTGEVRRVTQLERRLLEAARRGFTRALIPSGGNPAGRPAGLDVVEVRNLAEAVSASNLSQISSGIQSDS